MSYWYKFEGWRCPVCGRERIDKHRVYDKPRPRNVSERWEWIEHYDYCDV